MSDFEKFRKNFSTSVQEIRQCSEDSSPFVYSLVTRTAKGAAIGFIFSAFFFRSSSVRKSAMLFGAGCGLGMSSS